MDENVDTLEFYKQLAEADEALINDIEAILESEEVGWKVNGVEVPPGLLQPFACLLHQLALAGLLTRSEDDCELPYMA